MGQKMAKQRKGKKGVDNTNKNGNNNNNNNENKAESKDNEISDLDIDSSLSTKNDGNKIGIDDFELLKVLGKGSFGKVMLVRRKGEETLYAMKTLRKEALMKRNQLQHTATERKILQHLDNPFLVQLNYAFQTPDKLYMVLDYCSGGELFFWLKKERRFSESRTRLMSAEIVTALECLHSHDIIYRDLKPENILLDAEGHIKITDFGLSKEEVTGAGAEGGTKTFCGTPEYLAPEILENRGHGKAVDWWSLGTLMFEMLCGLPPFYDTNIQRMYHKILHSPLRFPNHLSSESKSILQGLLQRSVDERLGSGEDDAGELKRQPFFAVLDFNLVLSKEYVPEFRPPTGNDDESVENFDKEFTQERAVDSVVTSTLTDKAREKTNFEGFTYEGGGLNDVKK